jgi:CheY-like chemotaxis protein
MGGQIEVVSVPGAGTTFTFRLPLRAVEEPPEGNGLPVTTAVVAMVATVNAGLSRHLASRFAELGVSVQAIPQIPDEADVERARPQVVLIDSALLHGHPAAHVQLERLVEGRTKVVLVSPLVGESTARTSMRVPQLYKPVSRGALEALLEESPAAASKEASAASGIDGACNRPVVLLAEDDPVNQIVVASMLAACDLDVVTVADGSAALAVLRRQRVGLVLTDIRMPDMDGIAATRTLRQWERARGSVRTPVVAMTGQHEAEQAEACLEAGIDEVLLKPFRLDVLRRVLDIHLRRNN